MSRTLDIRTLDAAAKHYAAEFLREDEAHKTVEGRFMHGPTYVMNNFVAFGFKDEHDYLVKKIQGMMGSDTLVAFNKLAKERFEPRSDELLADMLAEKLAIDVDGNHIPGLIGTTKVNGARYMGRHMIEVERPDSIRRRKVLRSLGQDPGPRETHLRPAAKYWPIYAGEMEERLAGSKIPDLFPEGTPGLPVGALDTRISNEIAILMCDAAVDNLDEGTLGAVLEGRSDSAGRPADPDASVLGVLLFTLNAATSTTFGGAVDDTGKATATANTIDPDTAADATGTLLYVRASSSSVADTPLDDHIDGEAGTSGADFNFNTLAIVLNAQVDLTAWTVSQPES